MLIYCYFCKIWTYYFSRKVDAQSLVKRMCLIIMESILYYILVVLSADEWYSCANWFQCIVGKTGFVIVI